MREGSNDWGSHHAVLFHFHDGVVSLLPMKIKKAFWQSTKWRIHNACLGNSDGRLTQAAWQSRTKTKRSHKIQLRNFFTKMVRGTNSQCMLSCLPATKVAIKRCFIEAWMTNWMFSSGVWVYIYVFHWVLVVRSRNAGWLDCSNQWQKIVKCYGSNDLPIKFIPVIVVMKITNEKTTHSEHKKIGRLLNFLDRGSSHLIAKHSVETVKHLWYFNVGLDYETYCVLINVRQLIVYKTRFPRRYVLRTLKNNCFDFWIAYVLISEKRKHVVCSLIFCNILASLKCSTNKTWRVIHTLNDFLLWWNEARIRQMSVKE